MLSPSSRELSDGVPQLSPVETERQCWMYSGGRRSACGLAHSPADWTLSGVSQGSRGGDFHTHTALNQLERKDKRRGRALRVNQHSPTKQVYEWCELLTIEARKHFKLV